MPVTLPRLPRFAIIERNGAPALQLQAWWQSVVSALELAFAAGEANDTSIAAAIETLTTAVNNIETLTGLVDGLQPLDPMLTGMSVLTAGEGVIYQTGDFNFNQIPVGVAASTDILNRTSGDERYVMQDTQAAPSLLAYGGTTISNPPTQAEVQAVDAAVQAVSNAFDNLIAILQTAEVLI